MSALVEMSWVFVLATVLLGFASGLIDSPLIVIAGGLLWLLLDWLRHTFPKLKPILAAVVALAFAGLIGGVAYATLGFM